MSGIAPDVGHVNVGVFHLEEQILGVLQSDDVVVDVAVNSPQRLEGCELFSGLDVSDVTGMPNFVHVLKKVKDLGDNRPVGVRENADAFHGNKNVKLFIAVWLASFIKYFHAAASRA